MKRIFGFILVICLILSLCACGQKADTSVPAESASTWQEQYDLGIRYLSEGNYEEAIIAFTAAIEIDPKQVDAYIGLADVYAATGTYDKALEVLENGYAKTGSNLIAEKLTELKESQDAPDDVTEPEIPAEVPVERVPEPTPSQPEQPEVPVVPNEELLEEVTEENTADVGSELVYITRDSGLGSYQNELTLYPDGRFHLYVNLFAGMGDAYGTYSVAGDSYTFYVEERNYIGYTGDDILEFKMTKSEDTLIYTMEKNIVSVWKNSVFYLSGV